MMMTTWSDHASIKTAARERSTFGDDVALKDDHCRHGTVAKEDDDPGEEDRLPRCIDLPGLTLYGAPSDQSQLAPFFFGFIHSKEARAEEYLVDEELHEGVGHHHQPVEAAHPGIQEEEEEVLLVVLPHAGPHPGCTQTSG